MKKIFFLMAFAGILGSASATTINFPSTSKAIIAYNTGDEKKDDKKKDKDKAACKKDAKCAGKEKACCKKKAEDKKETSNATTK